MAAKTKVLPRSSGEGVPYSESMYASAPDSSIPVDYTGKVNIMWIAPAFFGYACQRREGRTQKGEDRPENSMIGIDSLFMTYHDAGGRSMPSLQQSFEEKFAQLHLHSMRYGAFGGSIMLSLYGWYDYYHYADAFPELMGIIFALRFAGMVPMLLLSGLFTYTKQYNQPKIRQMFLAVSTGVLGTMIITYSYITMAATQGTFALFFTMLFFLVPLGFAPSLLMGVTLWAGYLPCLLVSGEESLSGITSALIDWDVLQNWTTLFLSLVLYASLRYIQLKYLSVEVVTTACLARNRNTAAEERDRAHNLLLSCLPEEIIARLEEKQNSFARSHDSVTVLFCQVVGIDAVSAVLDEALGHQHGPHGLVAFLNCAYTAFDRIIDKCKCYKVETVMDVYMAVSGAPTEIENHADMCAQVACRMIIAKPQIRREIAAAIRELANNSTLASAQWKIDDLVTSVSEMFDIHIGLNSGTINAGVCGKLTPRYKLFGDTVNTASRMESTCPHGKVQASPATAKLISKHTFRLDEQPAIDVKGKGKIAPFWVSPVDDNGFATSAPIEPIPLRINGSKSSANEPSTKENPAQINRVTKSRRNSLLRQSTLGSQQGHDNEHYQDYIQSRGDSKEGAAGTSEAPPLEMFRYSYMGLWGSPHLPCRKSSCHGITYAYLMEQERRYEAHVSANAMRLLRRLAVITFLSSAALFYLDIQRFETIKNGICQNIKNEGACLDTEHASTHVKFEGVGLCAWSFEDRACSRNVSVLANSLGITARDGCQWVYDVQDPDRPDLKMRAENQKLYSLVTRFAGVGTCCLLQALITFVPWFRKRPFGLGQQLAGGIIIFSMGICIILLSWLSGEPGSGMLICWIFVAMYASNIRFAPRIFLLVGLSVIFAVTSYYINPYKSTAMLCKEPLNYIGTRMLFILFSVVSTALPIGKREIWLRSSFARKEAIKHSEDVLLDLDTRTKTMMSRLLPSQIVEQLSSQQRHERKAIAHYFHSVSIVFTDMKGFTAFSSTVTPSELVEFLNDMYQRFDDIAAAEEIFKVEISELPV